MKLYHGSDVVVNVPDLTKTKPFKDFGQGFYLSASRQQAQELAEQKALQTLDGKPVVNTFLFDEKVMTSGELKVLTFDDYTEEWAQFILDNRNPKLQHPIHDYDIVYGPIADDGVAYQLRRYQRGVIKTLAELIEELRYAKGITFQYFFGTQRALDKLKKI